MIEERSSPPAVVIERDRPDTSGTIEKREGILGTEKKTITRETTGSGDGSSKTVHKVRSDRFDHGEEDQLRLTPSSREGRPTRAAFSRCRRWDGT